MAESLELSQSEIQKMKIVDLKKELKSRGLPTTGSKKELLQRLEMHLSSGTAADADVSTEVKEDAVEDALDQVLEEGDGDEIVLDDSTTETENKPVAPSSNEEAEPDTKKKSVVSLQSLTEADKLKLRAKKFGVINEDLKKMTRAERFGIQSPNTGSAISSTTNAPADIDKLKKRAERFGTVIASTLTKDEEKEKLKKRAERFGTSNTTNTSTQKLSSQDQLLKRKARFGLITGPSSDSNEAKKLKRAERFGLT